MGFDVASEIRVGWVGVASECRVGRMGYCLRVWGGWGVASECGLGRVLCCLRILVLMRMSSMVHFLSSKTQMQKFVRIVYVNK